MSTEEEPTRVEDLLRRTDDVDEAYGPWELPNLLRELGSPEALAAKCHEIEIEVARICGVST